MPVLIPAYAGMTGLKKNADIVFQMIVLKIRPVSWKLKKNRGIVLLWVTNCAQFN